MSTSNPKQPAPAVQPQQAAPTRAFVSFSAEISPQTSESLLALCANLANQNFDEIYVLFSTQGGSVMHGIHLHNVLRSLPPKIVMHNVGSVNSIGNVVFLAGEERYCVPGATFMFHGVGFDITTAMRFEEKLLREKLDAVQADQRKIASIIEARSDFDDPQEIAELFLEAATRDDAYAVDKGLVHDIRDVQIPKGTPVHQLVFKR